MTIFFNKLYFVHLINCQKAETVECKKRIEFEFMKYVRALIGETAYPFEDVLYYSQCKHVEFKPQVPPHYT